MTDNNQHAQALPTRLRIALVAGTLGQAGAEKQLTYMARALRNATVDLRVYSLTRGEFYETDLREHGVELRHFGWQRNIRFGNIVVRAASLGSSLARFRPHIVQSAHFFCNLYAGLAGRFVGALSIGAMRNDLDHERKACGGWTGPLLRIPTSLIANSRTARRGVDEFGIDPTSIEVLDNVIDLEDFDVRSISESCPWDSAGGPVALAVGRMHPNKRFDRFLAALVLARKRSSPALRGVIVGDGPGWPELRRRAQELGLLPDGVVFLGRRNDVPALLRHADMLVLSSDHEGCPNVVLEAMAAHRPVVTTPAGDAGLLVEDGKSGYVVAFDDVEAMSDRMVALASSNELRHQLGAAGRLRVVESHSYESLASRMGSAYRAIAKRAGRRDVLNALDSTYRIGDRAGSIQENAYCEWTSSPQRDRQRAAP